MRGKTGATEATKATVATLKAKITAPSTGGRETEKDVVGYRCEKRSNEGQDTTR